MGTSEDPTHNMCTVIPSFRQLSREAPKLELPALDCGLEIHQFRVVFSYFTELSSDPYIVNRTIPFYNFKARGLATSSDLLEFESSLFRDFFL